MRGGRPVGAQAALPESPEPANLDGVETLPCPGCSTPLELSADVCPICLRPRSKLEITRGYARLKEEQARRRRRPFVIAGWLAAFSCAGWIAYRQRAPLAAAARDARARAERFVDYAVDPRNHMAHPANAPAALPPANEPPPPAAPAEPAVPPRAPAAPAPAPPPAPKAEKSPATAEDLPIPPLTPSQWAVYGRVYDLITLKPVPEAQLDFSIAGSEGAVAASIRTDEEGRYVLPLMRLPQGSYEIRAVKPGYAFAALYEADIPYAQLTLDERRTIVRSARDGDLPLPPLTDLRGEDSLRRDVFLAPRR